MSFSQTGRPAAVMARSGARLGNRRMRRPSHSAFLHFRPWYITPFFAAPVVPGESLKNALFQARILSSPVKNQVTGWWVETYWFYVKHRHLNMGSTLLSMMLDMSAAPTTSGSDDARFQHKTGDMPLVRQAYLRVVNEFFRGDGEAVNEASALPLQKARLRLPGWWDSILPTTSLSDGFGGIGDDTIGTAALDTVGEVGKAIEQWQTLVMLGVTNLEYDDWLRSFGVSIAAPVEDRPELLRYTREWQYPSSAVSVDATSQRVSSVLSWSLTERLDKDRFFKEPGVLLACVLARPKVYHDRQQAGIGQLQRALDWATPFNSGQPYQSYAPVVGLSGYSFDSRDLYIHGDQWFYSAAGTPNIPTTAFPADGAMDYMSDAEIDALFVDAANGHLKMDATVNLGIASAAIGPDVTPRTV